MTTCFLEAPGGERCTQSCDFSIFRLFWAGVIYDGGRLLLVGCMDEVVVVEVVEVEGAAWRMFES